MKLAIRLSRSRRIIMDEWKKYKLDEAYDFASGLSKGRDQFGFGFDFLGYKDIFQNYFIPEKLTSLVNSNEKERKTCSIKRGDVFLTRTSETDEELGLSSVALKDYPDATFNGFTKRLRPKGNIDILPEFAGFYFRSPRFRSTVSGISTITTRASLNNGMLSDLQITVPPIEIQKTISDILFNLHIKIGLLHRQNKTLEQLAETLFRQWFVEEEWTGKLSEYIKVQGGYAFKSVDFKENGFAGIIKITNISMEFVDISKCDYVYESAVKNLDAKFKIKSGDFLIAMTGAEIGKIGIVEKTKKEIWVNQRVGKLEAIVPYGNFIGYLALKSREGQDHISNACSGSVQENISTTGIEQMAFASYNSVKANSFGQQTQPLFEKIIFNLNQIRTLTQLRDTLLPKLMSGEVRVKINNTK
jgi:type I restriction enzyme, S subunit